MTNQKSLRALSADEFRLMAREFIPEAVKELRRLAASTDPSIAAEARRLLAQAETQGDIHPSDSAAERNTIKGNQEARAGL